MGQQAMGTTLKHARLLDRNAAAARHAQPYYLSSGEDVRTFEHCHQNQIPVLLKGPTGSGKTRFVEYMAWRLARPLVCITCHGDLTANDLLGRYLVRNDNTLWQDGPLTRAVRLGAICYFDDIVAAREDAVMVLHSLSDHRRSLQLDKTGEELLAPPEFQMVAAYDPGYQSVLKDLKPSTRQRFVALEFEFLPPEQEASVVAHEGGVQPNLARSLVDLGQRLRGLRHQGLSEVPSTRLLIDAARLVGSGIPLRAACYAALVSPLCDEVPLVEAMRDLVDATFP
jgi:nitric oxide reductase NorQ protein